MRPNELSSRLIDSVEATVLQELQDDLAAVARVSMGICDERGRLITRPSCGAPLCRLIAESRSGRAACTHSIELQAAAGPTPEPIAGACLAGVSMATVPVELDGRRLGTVVVCNRPTPPLDTETIATLARRHGLDEAELAAADRQSDEWSREQRRTAAECGSMLARVIGHMCRQDLTLHDRVDELTAVCNVAGLLAGTEDLEAILDSAARTVTEVMRVKACSIRLLDEATGELVMTAVHNLSDEYLNKGPVVRDRNSIEDAVMAGQTVCIADVAADPRIKYPEQARKEGIVSELCAPMTHRGQSVGVIRVYTGWPHRFSRFEASLVRAIGSQAAAAIVTARLFAYRQESQHYHRQLQYAGEIQRRMIPAEPPRHEYLTFGGVYAPSLEVGGDFYDYVRLPGDNLGLCVADVVGNGVPAALMMASVRSALRGHAHSIYEIDEIMAQVNQHLCRDTLVSEFATLFYGVFSPDGGQLTYCNAGHEPPLLLRGEQFRRLEAGGMVIGVSAEETFDKEVIDLKPGDVLAFVTDGVTEALNFEGQPFGRQRLREAVLRHRDEEANTLANQILWDVRRYAGLARQTDDLTVVVAKVG